MEANQLDMWHLGKSPLRDSKSLGKMKTYKRNEYWRMFKCEMGGKWEREQVWEELSKIKGVWKIYNLPNQITNIFIVDVEHYWHEKRKGGACWG